MMEGSLKNSKKGLSSTGSLSFLQETRRKITQNRHEIVKILDRIGVSLVGDQDLTNVEKGSKFISIEANLKAQPHFCRKNSKCSPADSEGKTLFLNNTMTRVKP